MGTKVNRISFYRILLICIVNIIVVWRDTSIYHTVLMGKESNFYEFLLFSSSNVYFIALFGVLSIWILMADYREITNRDLLVMMRFQRRSIYYKARMKNQALRVIIYVIAIFTMRFLIALLMQYPITTTWNYLPEYEVYTKGEIYILIGKIFLGMMAYFCFFTWLRENVEEQSSLLRIQNIVMGMVPLIELGLYKNTNIKLMQYLPLGHAVVYGQGYERSMMEMIVYWLLVLYMLWWVRITFYIQKDY